MDDLIAKVRAKLDAEQQRADSPHRLDCQLPGGEAYDFIKCDCDVPELWSGIMAAHQEMLKIYEDTFAIGAAIDAKIRRGERLTQAEARDVHDAHRELCGMRPLIDVLAKGYQIEVEQ